MRSLFACSLLALALGCGNGGGGTPPGTTIDAFDNGIDAAPVPLPSWQLEDVQPASPRAGQTYGLDEFRGKIIVVSLLEGF